MDFVIQNWDTIAQVLLLVLGFIMSLPWAKTKLAQANIFIEAHNLNRLRQVAVGTAAHLYANAIREMKANGKWNAHTKTLIFNQARDLIIEAATREGLPFLKEQIPSLIEWAVNKLKNDAPGKLSPPASDRVLPSTPSPVQPELGEVD